MYKTAEHTVCSLPLSLHQGVYSFFNPGLQSGQNYEHLWQEEKRKCATAMNELSIWLFTLYALTRSWNLLWKAWLKTKKCSDLIQRLFRIKNSLTVVQFSWKLIFVYSLVLHFWLALQATFRYLAGKLDRRGRYNHVRRDLRIRTELQFIMKWFSWEGNV